MVIWRRGRTSPRTWRYETTAQRARGTRGGGGSSRGRRCVPAESKDLALVAARVAAAKKARDVLVLDMREVFLLTDFFVICSGNTDRQVGAIQEAVEEKLAAMGVRPARREGVRHRRWVLLDYLDIVVHIFRQEEREYYEIERLWKDAPPVEWEEEEGRAATGV